MVVAVGFFFFFLGWDWRGLVKGVGVNGQVAVWLVGRLGRPRFIGPYFTGEKKTCT